MAVYSVERFVGFCLDRLHQQGRRRVTLVHKSNAVPNTGRLWQDVFHAALERYPGLAGSDEFPQQLEAPPALGPEIVPEGLPEFHERLLRQLPGCITEPLWLRGRVTGLLLCVGTPLGDLADIAKQGAAALELANDYTDYLEAARRRKPTTPAAEVQRRRLRTPPRLRGR